MLLQHPHNDLRSVLDDGVPQVLLHWMRPLLCGTHDLQGMARTKERCSSQPLTFMTIEQPDQSAIQRTGFLEPS